MRSSQRRLQSCLVGIGLTLAMMLGPASVFGGELDGAWRGDWVDNKSGHQGPLRARFQQCEDGNYRVVFSGRFAKVIPFRYTTTLNVVGRDGDQIIMAGESRVGGIMRFSYQAVADEHHFHSQYSSRRWTGEFNLCR